jgi:predicted dithiol-disulfide oxidoreductase (DUF899 family)
MTGSEERSMSMTLENLIPAAELARASTIRVPHESAEYRAARTALLAEEIALRRQIERVAAQRRALPPGGPVIGDYRFAGAEGPTDFAGLFAGKQTLAAYSYMFGPERERPCPMCTSMLDAWDGNAASAGEHLSLVVIARAPVERLMDWKRERGWTALRLYSDLTGDYSRDYFSLQPDGSDNPAFNVFTRRDGTIRHFWSEEFAETANPGQDPRGAPEPTPLWTILDCTPEGRRPDWYPSLD